MRFLALAMLALTCSRGDVVVDREPEAAELDVRITGGTIIDGAGVARYRGDIGIRGDTIVAVGNVTGRAKQTIDASGLVVAPGFIDLLGNSQAAVLIDPRLEGKIRQGVTTEVTGEGHSPAPIDEAMAAEMERTKPKGWPAVTWRSLDDFIRVVERKGTALNFAFYVGATNPREIVLGTKDVDPTPEQLGRMQEIVETAMRDGAFGLASALIYPPGRFAETDELIALARASGKHGGAYWTHLRNESSGIDAALDEAMRIGREAGVPVNVFHLKIGGRSNWGRMGAVIEKIEAAQKGGLDIAANIYPYTATSTELTSIVPAWALEGGYLAFVARLKDAEQRKRIADAIRGSAFLGRVGGAGGILVRGIPSDTPSPYERKRLDEIARMMKTDPAEASLRLFETSRSSPIAIYFSLSDDDMKLALKQPWVAVGCDSGAVVGEMRKAGAHPRAYGTFPRILGRYVREEKLLTLEEAVRKMTSLAASRAGLADRGVVKPGMKADLVVFDPATIRDVSTFEDPHHFSVGISAVLVNGTAVLREGAMTGALPGKVLRRDRREGR